MKLFPDFEKEWNNLKSPYKTEIKYFQLQNVKALLRRFYFIRDVKPELRRAKQYHEKQLSTINRRLSGIHIPVRKRKKYGKNPDILKRNDSIRKTYHKYRHKGMSPLRAKTLLANKKGLSFSFIDDIVKGKKNTR